MRLLAKQAQLAEPRVDHHAHDLHHAAVVDRLVAADEDALVGLLLVHGLELVGEVLQLVPGLAQEHLVLGIDRDDQGLVLAADLLGAGLGQVDRHADL